MKTDKSGGSAFPGENDHQSGNTTWHSSGMTMRQYYAAKALAGMCAHTSYIGTVIGFEKLPTYAFQLADAMIEFEEQGK